MSRVSDSPSFYLEKSQESLLIFSFLKRFVLLEERKMGENRGRPFWGFSSKSLQEYDHKADTTVTKTA